MTSQAVLSPVAQRKSLSISHAGWIGAGVLYFLLWIPEFKPLWADWNGDATLSHGPLIVVLAIALLWMQRDKIRCFSATSLPAGISLGIVLLVYMGGVWADIAFVRLLCLIAMPLGAIWFIGGWKSLEAAAGAIGLLVFMVPWPMTLTEHLTFPMQITSTTFAALLSGLCGMPVHQEGVFLSVAPNSAAKPLYGIMVASHCSGMASLMVLLTLGYLIAFYTPLKLGWKMLIMASVLPLTLCVNALRLTLILWAGAYHSAALADWIHHHEAPVLILFCSLGLTGLRWAIMKWAQQPNIVEGDTRITSLHPLLGSLRAVQADRAEGSAASD